MQYSYKNLYLVISKHLPFPSNPLPFSHKKANTEKMKKLMNVSLSIGNIFTTNAQQIGHRRKSSQYKILQFNRSPEGRHDSSSRIHHNYQHFLASKTSRSPNQNQAATTEQYKFKLSDETLRQKGNSTYVPKRKDLYDGHIQKYMSTKYDNQEIIDKYLTNREMFIQEAVQQIQKQIRQEIPMNNRSIEGRSKKYRSLLPKVEQKTSHMMKKPVQRNKGGVYLQQISQIKRAEELQLKQRRRRLRLFRHKMSSLQAKLSFSRKE